MEISIILNQTEFIIGSIVGAVVPATYLLLKAYHKLNGGKHG